MPLIATRGAASAQGFGEFARTGPVNYIEEVFGTYIYTGTGSTQTITNNIDLSGKGGMVWFKSRSSTASHQLVDTERGKDYALNSTLTATQQYIPGDISSFNADGFTLGPPTSTSNFNASSVNMCSWTFRKQPKFFDIQIISGNGSTQVIPHNLGSTPGCIIIKRLENASSDWIVYHRSLPNGVNGSLILNNTVNEQTSPIYFSSVTSTSFTVEPQTAVNANFNNYVAYIFAHDAGGFGTSGSDNVISCGSYTGTSATGNFVNLGFEPQWILIKSSTTSSGQNWHIVDNMRGISNTNSAVLYPNLSNSENFTTPIQINSNGFTINTTGSAINSSSGNYIYIAIRRGPMKTPTTGTSVYSNDFATGTGTSNTLVNANFPPDLYISKVTNATGFFWLWYDRLRGGPYLKSNSSDAEVSSSDVSFTSNQNGAVLSSWAFVNGSSYTNSRQSLRRAPGFFDIVCYTGTGSNTTVTHNLGVAPELVILKRRNSAEDWPVLQANIPTQATLNGTFSGDPPNSSYFGNGTSYVAPTSTVFSVGTNSAVNASGGTYVAYLFATVAGVSKVGSYTGTGSTQTINCGFAAGARFVLIKRTNGTGDWYFYDSARGITSGNDPYLWLNTDDQQVTSTNFINTNSAGFELNGSSLINASGGTFIFLAIA